MARLPISGGDSGTWGDILNQFLLVEHNNDGSLKNSGTLGAYAPLSNPVFTGSVTVPTPTSASDAVTKAYADSIVASGAPDATTSSKGIVQLAGDLTGSAASPQVAAGAITNSHISGSAAIDQSKIANLTSSLSGKSDVNHTHAISEVTNLQSTLDSKFDENDVVDEDTMSSNSSTKVPTQQSVKAYVDNEVTDATSVSNLANSLPYKNKGLSGYFSALQNSSSTPVNIVVVGDSISVANCIGGESSWAYLFMNEVNRQTFSYRPKNGWRAASGNDTGSGSFAGGVPGLLTNLGSSVASGTGGYSTTLTNGQTATYTATMDGVSVIYSSDPSFGSLEVRDGGPSGTLLATINCSGTTKAGRIWTSNTLSLASHDIHLTSVGNTKLEALYIHTSDVAKGVRVWNASHSGYRTSHYLSDSTLALDFIENLNPQLVIIATGTNDLVGNYADDITALYNNIQSVSSADIAFWIPYINNNYTTAKMAAGRAAAQALNAPYFDSAQLMGDQPLENSKWAGFGVHPNLWGAGVIARQATNFLSGDPLAATERALSLKMEQNNPYYLGTMSGQSATFSSSVTAQTLTSTSNLSVVSETFKVEGLFGGPIVTIKEVGNSFGQIYLTTSTVNNALTSGAVTGPSISLGTGSANADVTLHRTAAGQISINQSQGTLQANIAPSINLQSGTSYTLVSTDAGKQIVRSNGSSSTQTLPQDSDATIPVGTVIPIINAGTDIVTFQAGTGATVGGDTQVGASQRAIVTKVGANTWFVSAASSGSGSFDAAAITSGTIATARLGSGAASANTVLTGASTFIRRPRVLSANGGASAFSNTTTETSILSTTPSLTANTLAVGDVIELEFQGSYLNNSGATQTLTTRIKLGGTTLETRATGNVATNAFAPNYYIRSYITILSTTSALCTFSGTVSAPLNINVPIQFMTNSSTVTIPDITANSLDIDATMQMSTNTATSTVTPKSTLIKFSPAD